MSHTRTSIWNRFRKQMILLLCIIIVIEIIIGYLALIDSSIEIFVVVSAAIAAVLVTINLMATRQYGIHVRGYEGIVHRVLKAPRNRNEYFIQGKPESTFREVVRENWPFEDQDVNSSWKLVSASSEDITDKALSSYEGTVEIVFIT